MDSAPTNFMEAERMEREKRIEILEKRLVLLEKDVLSQPSSPLEEALGCGRAVLFSIPLFPLLAFVTSFYGLHVMVTNGHFVHSGLEHLSLSFSAQELAGSTWLICLVFGILNVAILFVAFPATGSMREYVFGREHSGGVMLWISAFCGPCVLYVLLAFCIAAFLLLLGGVAVVLPATTLFGIVAGACDADTTKDLSPVLSALLDTDASRTKAAMTGICSADYSTMAAGNASFGGGLALACFGQVWLLVTHASNLQKVLQQKDLDGELKSGKA
eukprot:TRINITY_DN24910_c0_g1_i1.p1 TRINITY_DN24910_c0_g1~~TRINITY_DN24910_c0_g1_i1.p1  ORF type:complete len:273 (-),score=67.73 TRINITY_DN24910_c0_g1_i1:259-1077(-)